MGHAGFCPSTVVRHILQLYTCAKSLRRFNRKMTAVGTPTDETTPRELLKLLSRSRFCVVPPADTSSIGKRFYDAVLTECIPVVIAFPTKYGLGKSWWTFDGTPVEWSLPFAQQGLDYSKLAIEIPVEELRRGNAVAYLAAVSEAVVAKRLASLRAVRNHLIFDYGGETIDAFSLAVRQLLSLLPTARAACFSQQAFSATFVYC